MKLRTRLDTTLHQQTVIPKKVKAINLKATESLSTKEMPITPSLERQDNILSVGYHLGDLTSGAIGEFNPHTVTTFTPALLSASLLSRLSPPLYKSPPSKAQRSKPRQSLHMLRGRAQIDPLHPLPHSLSV